MVSGILEFSSKIVLERTGIADAPVEAGSVTIDNCDDATELPATEHPSFTVVTEHDKEPLLSIVAESEKALSGMTRFLRCDGPVEDLLFNEGPLVRRQAAGYLLRELLRSEQTPLGFRPIADGNTLMFGATNETAAKAFKLLAQGALGYPFVLSS